MVSYFRSSTPAKVRTLNSLQFLWWCCFVWVAAAVTIQVLTCIFKGEAYPRTGANGEAKPRGNSRGGDLVEQHLPHAVRELRKPVGAALASLSTDITLISFVPAPSNDTTVKLSEEKMVSGSKVISLLSMLDHWMEEEVRNATAPVSISIANHIRQQLRHRLQKMSITSLTTLFLFKSIDFFLAPQSRGSQAAHIRIYCCH